MSDQLRFYAVTHDILGDPFWEIFKKGLSDAANTFSCDVTHLRPNVYSSSQMKKLLGEAIEAKPHGLLSTIPELWAVEEPLVRAIQQNIPVIAVNTPDPRPKGEQIPYLFFIGSNDYLGGQVAAQQTLVRGNCVRALCVDHYEFDQVCHQARYRGYADFMQRAGVLSQRLQVTGTDEPQSVQQIRDYLQDYPAVDAILTLGPPGASSVITVLDAANAHHRIRHVTFDLSPRQLAAIQDHKILAAIDSQQYLQGFLGIEHLWLYARYGFTLAADILTGPAIVTLENLDTVWQSVRNKFR